MCEVSGSPGPGGGVGMQFYSTAYIETQRGACY